MVDRLRQFANRPLRDGDRVRLFGIVVALIVGVAGALGGPRRRRVYTPEPRRPRIAAEVPATSTAAAIAATPVPAAPSEESEFPPFQRAALGDVTRSKRSARRFLAGYLPFAYGRGTAADISAATPALRAGLARRRPRVPATERRRRPRLELLQSNGVTRERAELVALVDDGKRRYSVPLELANTPSGWLVTGLGS